MNKLKSLAVTFALATAGLLSLGGAAQAQTNQPGGVSVTQTQTSSPDLVQNNSADPRVIQAVSQLTITRENYFPNAKTAFTTARVDQTGENIAVQWNLEGNGKSPAAVFNMDDPSGQSQQAFENARATARATEASYNVTPTYVSGGTRYIQPVPIYVPTYTYVAPIRPIVVFGPVFRPWNPLHIFAPVPYYGYGGYNNHGSHTTVIIRGGNDHRGGGYDRGHDRGNDRGGPQHGPQHGHRR